jgi:homoserine O-acetyltransferase
MKQIRFTKINAMPRNIIIILFLLAISNLTAQSKQQFANLGDFTTMGGDIIKNCKVGYRTMGILNAEKTNAVLCPTRFTGKSENSAANLVMDTTGLFVIMVDALTNGVSSSPSNTPNFPSVTITDMVHSQHQMLTKHLGIDHLYAVIGVSMGGMQAFEWLVTYPDFMDKVVPIVGTPKQTSYDLMAWQTAADIIIAADEQEGDMKEALRLAHNIELMHIASPNYIVNKFPADSAAIALKKGATSLDPCDYLGGVKAMISQDIYKSSKQNIDTISAIIKADLLVIVAAQDHVVHPSSASQLAKKLAAPLVTLMGDCGHVAFSCESEKVKTAVTKFLKRN